MFYLLSKILWVVVAPAHLIAGSLLLGTLCRWRWLTRAGLAALVLLTLCPVDAWLRWPLEARFAIGELPQRVDGVIVLGGMIDTSSSATWGRPRLNSEADRLTDFVWLARRYPEARLVFTGGAGLFRAQDLPEAPLARQLVERLGLAPERVLFEDRSRNTYENVLFSRELARPQPGETWLLVTSASHMPRAVGVFRQLGWPVQPWPVAFHLGRGQDQLPSLDLAGTLYRLDQDLHEWAGLVSYYLLGRTSALLPAPE